MIFIIYIIKNMFIKFILNKPYKHIIRGEMNMSDDEIVDTMELAEEDAKGVGNE